MISRDELKSIGQFQRTHGLHGELNALMDIDPEFLEQDYPIIMEIDGTFVPFFIDTVRPKGARTDLVKLENVDTEEEAKSFVNKSIYALRSDLTDFFDDDELTSISDLIGFSLVDMTGNILGVVSDVDDSTSNVLLYVDSSNGGVSLIPMVDEFIKNIDYDKKIIFGDIPDELLELNQVSE